MTEQVYKPDIYEGGDPFIQISFHSNDRERVFRILEKLDMRGFRFWLSEGIAPGMDTDEIIARHIEDCTVFIAFLSGSYLGFLDTVDELNYSRDVDKEYLLVYLENVALPAGLDMRFQRAQSVMAAGMSDEELYERLVNIHGADRFYGVADPKLRGQAEKVFAKLEELYPEHKVFALDAVGKQVSKAISELYVKAGYSSVERLMLDYGFEHISSADARKLRSSVLYQPGYEPAAVKPRIDHIMDTLSSHYPDRNISDNLSMSHHAIYKSLTGISIWMGYDSVADMLLAYGFSGVVSKSGRIEIDHERVIRELAERYEGKEKPSTVSQIVMENPDMSANLKTLNNRAAELYGMTFYSYLKDIGLVVRGARTEQMTVAARNRDRIEARIRNMYEAPSVSYGTFEDAEDTFSQIVVRENKAGNIYVSDCSSCSETMRIPYGVRFIGKEAFCGQSDMTTLILPPTVEEIKECAFMDCDGLETIVFSEGLQRIGKNAFFGCVALKKLSLPSSLQFIDNTAFFNCKDLTEVSFGNARTSVRSDAFDESGYELGNMQDEGASPAEYFELKVNKKNQASILAYKGSEEVVVIPEAIAGHPVISIEKGAFKGNMSVREVYMNDHINAINGDVFRDCANLEKVHLSESITRFTSGAFAGCTSLGEINIPDCMEEVPRGLFKESPLTVLYVGRGVKSISPDAFYKGDMDPMTGVCFKKKSLQDLIIDTGNDAYTADGTTLLSKDGKTLIAELGDPVTALIPEGVEEIGPQAYEKLNALCEVVLPASLRRIGEKAFAGTNLKRLELPENVEEIGPQAFSYCRELSEVEFPEQLKVIAQQAFEGCPIADVFIPASVEYLGSDSFLAISTFQGQIKQRFRVDTANEHVFVDGMSLYRKEEDGGVTLVKAYNTGLRLKPNEEGPVPIRYAVRVGTTAIAPHAFAQCNNLASVTLPDGLLSIGDLAFWGCSGLKEIHIPESCADVSAKAFFGMNIAII